MKKLLLAALVVALAFVVATPSNAQGKFYLNPGLDVYFPMGDFGDAVNVGFGGTVRGEYVFTKEISGTFAIGYDIWSGKSIDINGTSYSADFKGIPIVVGGKYYFMPEAAKTRVYGMIELGFFMATISLPEYKDPFTGITYGGGTETSTAFMFDPMVGAEFAVGKVTIDGAVRYLLLSKDGSRSNFGVRVGVKFPIGG